MESRLGNGLERVPWDSPHEALLAVADQLRLEAVPLSDVLREMILASTELNSLATPTSAVGELLAEPMTAAESVGTLLLATTAVQARDAHLDDERLLRVMAVAAVLVARFETYLAERDVCDAP